MLQSIISNCLLLLLIDECQRPRSVLMTPLMTVDDTDSVEVCALSPDENEKITRRCNNHPFQQGSTLPVRAS